MNLDDFEHSIDGTICNRGHRYFRGGRVIDFEVVKKDHYSAFVLGSDSYTVKANINGNLEILSSSCNCPYNLGPYCKHEVAVFYYFRTNGFIPPSQEPTEEEMEEIEAILEIKPTNVRSGLLALTKLELITIIEGLAKRNHGVRKEIMWELGMEGEEPFL